MITKVWIGSKIAFKRDCVNVRSPRECGNSRHFLKVPCVDGYLLARISSDASAGLVGPASVRLSTTVFLTAGYNAGRVRGPDQNLISRDTLVRMGCPPSGSIGFRINVRSQFPTSDPDPPSYNYPACPITGSLQSMHHGTPIETAWVILNCAGA